MATSGSGSSADSINHLIEKLRVSSVLNRDVKQFGKQYLLDGDEETCWNSEQGKNQSISIQFKCDVRINEVQFKFQGGFSAGLISIEDSEKGVAIETHMKDNSELQKAQFGQILSTNAKLNITLKKCTDTFGRITVYTMNIIGHKL